MLLLGFLALIIVAIISEIVAFKGVNFLGKIEEKYRDGIATELSSAEELKNKIIGKIDIYTEQKKESSSPFKKFINYFDEILKKLKLGLQNNLKPGPLEPIPLDIYKEVLSTL